MGAYRKNIKAWQYILIGLFILLAVGLTVLDAWLTPYSLDHERKAARAAGIPVFPAEFVRPKPPPGKDAGPDWLAFARSLQQRHLDDSAVARPGSPPSEQEVRKLLASRPDLIRLIHRMAGKRTAYFEHTWSIEERFPYDVTAREAAKLLRWESWLMARDGRYAEAVRNQAPGFRLANQIGDDPVLISYLVSAAMESITLDGMADILRMAGPDPRATAAVRHALLSDPSRRNYTRALQSETLFCVEALRRVHSMQDVRYITSRGEESDYVLGSRPANGLVVHYISRQSEAAYLQWMTRYAVASRLPVPQRAAAMDAVSQAIADRNGKLIPPGERLAVSLFPVFAKAEGRDTATHAHRRVLLAACDVLDARARTGTWPARLPAGSLLDPFSGKPLGYRREGTGFVIYSVGEEKTFAARPGQKERGQALFRFPDATTAAPAP